MTSRIVVIQELSEEEAIEKLIFESSCHLPLDVFVRRLESINSSERYSPISKEGFMIYCEKYKQAEKIPTYDEYKFMIVSYFMDGWHYFKVLNQEGLMVKVCEGAMNCSRAYELEDEIKKYVMKKVFKL